MKKTDRKKLEKELDKLWSRAVISSDKACRYSNSTDRLSAHHIRSRRHAITRWNLENGLCLAWSVHFLQKANPELFHDRIIEIIGQKEYNRLKKISDQTYKWSLEELERIKEQLLEAINQNG
jgi:hypothetical protein